MRKFFYNELKISNLHLLFYSIAIHIASFCACRKYRRQGVSRKFNANYHIAAANYFVRILGYLAENE